MPSTKPKKFIILHIADQTLAMPLTRGEKFINYSNIQLMDLLQKNKYVLGITYTNSKIVTILDTATILDIKNKKKNYTACLLFDFNNDSYGLVVEKAGNIIEAKKINKDNNKKIFNRYIMVNNQRTYIIDPFDLFHTIKIYE